MSGYMLSAGALPGPGISNYSQDGKTGRPLCRETLQVLAHDLGHRSRIDRERQDIKVDGIGRRQGKVSSVSYTHLRAHETRHDLVCRLLLEKKKKNKKK